MSVEQDRKLLENLVSKYGKADVEKFVEIISESEEDFNRLVNNNANARKSIGDDRDGYYFSDWLFSRLDLGGIDKNWIFPFEIPNYVEPYSDENPLTIRKNCEDAATNIIEYLEKSERSSAEFSGKITRRYLILCCKGTPVATITMVGYKHNGDSFYCVEPYTILRLMVSKTFTDEFRRSITIGSYKTTVRRHIDSTSYISNDDMIGMDVQSHRSVKIVLSAMLSTNLIDKDAYIVDVPYSHTGNAFNKIIARRLQRPFVK